jgi:tripartite-type tricarboxylate transporter receptor subunit TctC
MAMSGVELVHVPYSGNFFTDLISGKVNVAFSPVASVIGGIRDGTLRLGRNERNALADVPGRPCHG